MLWGYSTNSQKKLHNYSFLILYKGSVRCKKLLVRSLEVVSSIEQMSN